MNATTVRVSDYLAAQMQICGKSQKEIAEEVGFPKANVLTMIKKGQTKLPIPRVPAMAKSLGVDPARLMRIVLAEYHPEILEAIEGTMGDLPES